MKRFLMLLGVLTLTLTGCNNSEEGKDKHSRVPVVDAETNTVQYGLYPQTHVSDETLIAELNELIDTTKDNWYHHKGEYYVWINAQPTTKPYKFDDGETIETYKKYWFKCEPITWNILSNNDGVYYLLSSKLLDNRCYHSKEDQRMVGGRAVYENNYEYSFIRTWLRGLDGRSYDAGNYIGRGFKDLAFVDKVDESYIQFAQIDNSISSTDGRNNRYICANTYDDLFLPSYKDFLTSEYGFSDSDYSSTRLCRTTDYVRARGAEIEITDDNQYYGSYWTRSPYSIDSNNVWCVNSYGGLFAGNVVTNTKICLRPAINLKIS